jgi:hypothetical protein
VAQNATQELRDALGDPTKAELEAASEVLEATGRLDASPDDLAMGMRLFDRINQMLTIIEFLRNVASAGPDAPSMVTQEVKDAATLVADTVEDSVPPELLETTRMLRALSQLTEEV